MSIARLLRRAKSPDAPEKLADVLDKEITRKQPPFSLLRVRAAAQTLHTLLHGEEFSRDQLWRSFFELHDAMYASDSRAAEVFHPSSLEEACSRQLYYELSKTPVSDLTLKKHDGPLQRTFDQGTWFHTYVQYNLYRAGVLEASEVPVVSKKWRINGKVDGILKPSATRKRRVLEIKTAASYSFSKLGGKPFKKHIYQASLYADLLGLEQIHFLYYNKENSQLAEFVVDKDKAMLEDAYNKMQGILLDVSFGTAPSRRCASIISENALKCPFKTHCFHA